MKFDVRNGGIMMRKIIVLLVTITFMFPISVFGQAAGQHVQKRKMLSTTQNTSQKRYYAKGNNSTKVSANKPSSAKPAFPSGQAAVNSSSNTILPMNVEYKILDNISKTCEVVGCKDNPITSPNIPLKIDGYTVVSIGKDAFKERKDVKKIVIPSSVNKISDFAFEYCRNLTSIEIPYNVKEIGAYAFSSCWELISAIFPNSVTSIGKSAFSFSGLSSIAIPSSVTKIDSNPFFKSNRLSSIVVEKNNPVYDSRNNCNAIIETKSNKLVVGCKSTIIPDDVIIIGESALSYELLTIKIPKNVAIIMKSAFWGAPETVISITVDPNNKYYDSRNGCNAIIETSTNTLIVGCRNTVIPNNVVCIKEDAFAYCHTLKAVNLPSNLISIGNNAFRTCYDLTTITIPQTVTSIGNDAFWDCRSLKTVICKVTNPFFLGNNAFLHLPSDAILYVPIGTKSAYEQKGWGKYFSTIVER